MKSIFTKELGVASRRAGKLEKVGWDWKNKKKRRLAPLLQKLKSDRIKLFPLWTSHNLSSGYSMSNFDSDPLTFDHAPFLPKNKQNGAKRNLIFYLKGRRDTALILQFLGSPMAELFLKII